MDQLWDQLRGLSQAVSGRWKRPWRLVGGGVVSHLPDDSDCTALWLTLRILIIPALYLLIIHLFPEEYSYDAV